MDDAPVRAAILDYGMGNLFSVKHACERAGMHARITADKPEVLGADVVILPGVGAFGDAMEALRRLDLVAVLRDVAASDALLVGICLGMQLLMTESAEFGRHHGLDLIPGDVRRLERGAGAARVKVPQVGWNHVDPAPGRSWSGSWLDGVPPGACFYFVHSFYVRPIEASVVTSTTAYGSGAWCSSLQRGRILACQFHPERSGRHGLQLYRNVARLAGCGTTRPWLKAQG